VVGRCRAARSRAGEPRLGSGRGWVLVRVENKEEVNIKKEALIKK